MDCFSFILDDKNYFEKLMKKDICLYGAGTKGRQTLYLLRKKELNQFLLLINALGNMQMDMPMWR